MSEQLYLANVAHGANITGYFSIKANTLQDAASLAVRAYDQNVILSGMTVTVGNTQGLVHRVANTQSAVTVYVKDPGAPDQTKAWQMTVQAASIIPPTIATYTANGISAPFTTTGA